MSTPAGVRADERDGIRYLEAGGIQISVERGDEFALVTALVPLPLLAALRDLLNHPALASLLVTVPDDTASPSMA